MINPAKYAKNEHSDAGILNKADFLRLAEFAVVATDVSYDYKMYENEHNLPVIEGKVSVSVLQNCQRCLKDFENTLECSFKVIPLTSDEKAKSLEEHGLTFDTCILNEGMLNLVELLEDELLLELPIVPKHPNTQAGDCVPVYVGEETQSTITEVSPFASLKALKGKVEK